MTLEECKNEVANNNNFDSFKRAIRYTFNRELLQSEEDFINKIINESMESFARHREQLAWEAARSVKGETGYGWHSKYDTIEEWRAATKQ
jgi:hypothetical protein